MIRLGYTVRQGACGSLHRRIHPLRQICYQKIDRSLASTVTLDHSLNCCDKRLRSKCAKVIIMFTYIYIYIYI